MERKQIDPDRLRRQPASGPAHWGKLKVFFGYGPGVGTTYAMLQEARRRREQGWDVVVGAVAAHTAPQTLQLLEGLPQLQPFLLSYKSIRLEEFDLTAALERRPQLLVLDELGHTNAEGCRHSCRFQDVEELLAAGIDVYTTLRLQQLQGMADRVYAITGLAQEAVVPDRLFDRADQVQLVDLEPEELMRRQERPPWGDDSLQQALSLQHLSALRQLALRRAADRLEGPAPAAAAPGGQRVHVLVCLSEAPGNARVVRAASEMAQAFGGDLTALLVETPRGLSAREGRRGLQSNLRLARELGARVTATYGKDEAMQILEYARASGVTHLVVGRRAGHRGLFGRSLADQLAAGAPGIEVHILSDGQGFWQPRPKGEGPSWSWTGLAKVAVVVAVCSLINLVLDRQELDESNLMTVYILGVQFASIWAGGRVCGVVVSIASMLVFNFFFASPRLDLRADMANSPATLIVMLLASFITSSLAVRIKEQARQQARRAYRTEVLLETSQKLQQCDHREDILRAAGEQLFKLLGHAVVLYPGPVGDQGQPPLVFPGESPPEKVQILTAPAEQEAALWALSHNRAAGAGTGTFSQARCQYLPIHGQQGAVAVAGLDLEGGRGLDAFDNSLLAALLDECGLVLEKQALAQARQQMELQARQEALRANLLRTISHDLRTPLTSITGKAAILMEGEGQLSREKRQEFYSQIYDDATWLINLVENLLSITRMENGALRLRAEPELVEDVLREAMAHLDRKAADHQITLQLEEELLMARMDGRLIVQVVINLLNNAIKYTPAGSSICLSARRQGQWIEVQVADDGPGIPEEAKGQLFEMFYTANNARGDGRRGLGLGLALCRSIVQAHGGTIRVENRSPHGAVFTFTLTSAEVDLHEHAQDPGH